MDVQFDFRVNTLSVAILVATFDFFSFFLSIKDFEELLVLKSK